MDQDSYFTVPERALDKGPSLAPSAFLAAGARVMGDVRLGEESSVWYNCVLRGDIQSITIGARSNVQDGSVLHVENSRALVIGEDVTVGHMACLHACTIGDGALIGMTATVLSGAEIGEGALVAAGALVLEKQIVPPRTLVVGRPAKVVRTLSDDEVARHKALAAKYVKVAALHKSKYGNAPV